MLDFDNLADLATGCAILGGGGGGDPITGLRMAHEAFSSYGAVRVAELDDLPADQLVVPCAMLGAPTVALEKIPSGAEGERIVEEVERRFGRPVAALMAIEIGGLNGTLPVTWAARTGLPYADADGMGRAFPLVTQTTMNVAGISAGPCVLVDERGNAIVVDPLDAVWCERLIRPAVAGLGGACAIAMYVMTVAEARAATVRGSVSRALAVGAALAGEDGDDPAGAVTRALGATEIVEGKLVEVERTVDGRTTDGHAIVERVEAGRRRLVRLEFQNENVAAVEDGVVLACAPDVLTLLDAASGQAIATERMRSGQLVRLVAFRSPEVWHREEGLALAGPHAFGYDIPDRPLKGRLAGST